MLAEPGPNGGRAVWGRLMGTVRLAACWKVLPNLPSGPQLFAVKSAVQGTVKAAVRAFVPGPQPSVPLALALALLHLD